MTKNLRRLGLGVMGFADLLVDLNIPYDSKVAVELSEYLSWFIQYHSWLESIQLAKERGPFSFYDPDKVNLSVVDRTLNSKYSPKEYDMKEVTKIGIRNNGTMSLAPTGSISIIGGVNSGIEPFFALSYKRNITEGIGNIATDSLFEINPALENKLKEYNYSEEDRKEILEYSSSKGTLTGCSKVSKEFQDIFMVANEISGEAHIAIQAAWQKYCSNAISKTINLPEHATIEDVYNIYIQMWKAGLKGGTIYRNNSRLFQILEQPGKE
jgi:ribonucleoside-diphosphate reductase alpha chain